MEYTELLRCDLTPEEWQEHARHLAATHQTRAELEQRKKEIDSQLKSQIEEQIGRAGKLSILLTNGYEMREVPCLILTDTPNVGTARIVRKDTGEFVRERPMTEPEKQQVLDFMVNNPAPDPPANTEPITDESRLIEGHAYPAPVHGDIYDDASARRLGFDGDGAKDSGVAEIRFLEIGPDKWISAVSWNLGGGKERHEPLRSNITYQTQGASIMSAAGSIFADMVDFVTNSNRRLAKNASAIADWADRIIAENGGPRTRG